MGSSWNFEILAAELRADLDSDAGDETISPPIPPLLPANVKGFTISRVIASGGMGTVYEARQLNPGRRVALKIMKTGVASREAMKRFQFEADTLARLNHPGHPGIAQIYQCDTYDDGTGGVPYFAMELVEDAESITNYCNDKHLSTRRRLMLFAEVCDAVHHGHQKGIVHRDLKPSNILVNADGHPKIIDFGIARSTDVDFQRTLHTELGRLIGTLAYMSPEQCDPKAHINVDVRSDVYALGVVLYELLCGRLPYEIEGKSHTQVARTIEESPPIEPVSVRKELKGNINAILLKALEKDQKKRYQSAEEFAADLRRHLKKEPISARPPSRWQKAARWVGRHPVVGTTLICAAIAAAILIGTEQLVKHRLRTPRAAYVSPFENQAVVLSGAGTPIRDWTTTDRGGIVRIALFDGAGDYQGHKLVAVAFGHPAYAEERGKLQLFDFSKDTYRPIWEDKLESEDLPDIVRKMDFAAEEFSPCSLLAADIFPDNPGTELLVIFSHSRSFRCLRIYDSSRNNVLFQVWHDGSISTPVWLAKHELLVTAGDNKEVSWESRDVKIDAYPVVAFAIRPTMGHIEHFFFQTSPPFESGCIEWYKVLFPAEAAHFFVTAGATKSPVYGDHEETYRISASDSAPLAVLSLSFAVRFDGVLLPDGREMGEQYRRAFERKEVADPAVFDLTDLPPTLPDHLAKNPAAMSRVDLESMPGEATKNLKNE